MRSVRAILKMTSMPSERNTSMTLQHNILTLNTIYPGKKEKSRSRIFPSLGPGYGFLCFFQASFGISGYRYTQRRQNSQSTVECCQFGSGFGPIYKGKIRILVSILCEGISLRHIYIFTVRFALKEKKWKKTLVITVFFVFMLQSTSTCTINNLYCTITPKSKSTSTVCTGLGVLEEPYSAKPAQRSSHTGSQGYIGWTLDTAPAYVDWRACTATTVSGLS